MTRAGNGAARVNKRQRRKAENKMGQEAMMAFNVLAGLKPGKGGPRITARERREVGKQRTT